MCGHFNTEGLHGANNKRGNGRHSIATQIDRLIEQISDSVSLNSLKRRGIELAPCVCGRYGI